MAGWFTSNSAFDEQIEKATSSGLEDMAANLEICDVIRSKSVPPKEAMRSLKRRIGHKNPNIQLSALQLTDACVKNGGSHFLAEIASREFIDNLVSLLKAPTTINSDVKARILELIQAWASAFEGKSNLSHVNETYRLLRADGYNFPPAPKVSSTFIDSSAPPEWADSDVCMRCRSAFTMMNRKHHCRNCGNVFDAACSSNSLPLPHIGIIQPVRVCDGCHVKLTEKKISRPIPNQASKPTTVPAYMQPRNARVEDDYMDEDLKMALKMSLDEVQGGKSSGYVSQQQLKTKQPTDSYQIPSTSSGKQNKSSEEDDDADLKAAIQASLADMEVQKKNSAWSNPVAAAATQPQNVTSRPDYELSPTEAENINLFSTFVDRLQTQPPGTILREPGIQELYESMNKLRPKLARTFGETMSKYEALCDLHAKLSTVVRYYDKMLEDRLAYSYNRHTLGNSASTQYNRPNSNYGVIPQNAESYYGVNVRSPPPQQVAAPYTRPQSVYQQVSSPTMPHAVQNPQYARPPSAAPSVSQLEQSQKYNMYPSMPAQALSQASNPSYHAQSHDPGPSVNQVPNYPPNYNQAPADAPQHAYGQPPQFAPPQNIPQHQHPSVPPTTQEHYAQPNQDLAQYPPANTTYWQYPNHKTGEVSFPVTPIHEAHQPQYNQDESQTEPYRSYAQPTQAPMGDMGASQKKVPVEEPSLIDF